MTRYVKRESIDHLNSNTIILNFFKKKNLMNEKGNINKENKIIPKCLQKVVLSRWAIPSSE